MSTKRLEHLKEGDKIYLEVTKADCEQDIHPYYKFNDGYGDKMLNVNTYNSVSYTLEDLKQLANDGMPKQGEKILVSEFSDRDFKEFTFIGFSYGKAVTEYYHPYDVKKWSYYKLKPKKTELTLAEIEEKLGLEKGSLTIKD